MFFTLKSYGVYDDTEDWAQYLSHYHLPTRNSQLLFSYPYYSSDLAIHLAAIVLLTITIRLLFFSIRVGLCEYYYQSVELYILLLLPFVYHCI